MNMIRQHLAYKIELDKDFLGKAHACILPH